MTSSDANLIIGHKKQLLQLAQDLDSNNLSHAYLFAGSPHLGKMTVARWFGTHILTRGMDSEQKEVTETQIDKLLHRDFLVLDQLWMEERCEDWDVIAQTSNFPQQHRAKAKMKTDVISIDDVREIQQQLNETGDLPHRVCIIRKVERMQDAAANAFLKILEEPPEGRVFILTTETLTSLIPTILSRTRVMRFERAADRDLQVLLKDVTEEDASFILHVAQGAPGIAIKLMNDPEALRAEKLLHTQAVSFWSSQKLLDRIKLLSPLEDRGPEADRFLFHLSLALRETPAYGSLQERSLMELLQGFKTNAHRGLMMEQFAISSSV
jgi:DNA polymerase III subunit delta'